MNCLSKFLFFLFAVLALCSCFIVGALGAGSTYTIAWESENSFRIPLSSSGSYYLVECNSTGTWAEVWEKEITVAQVPPSFTALPGIVADYRVKVFDTPGGDLQYTSNTLSYSPKLFSLSFDYDKGVYGLSWDSVENASSYTIQFSSDGSSWTNYLPYSSQPADVLTFFVFDENLVDKYVRVVAYKGSRILNFSNVVQVSGYTETGEILPYDSIVDPPAYTFPALPNDTYPELNVNDIKPDVRSFWDVSFSFLKYTALGQYFILALGILCTFAVVSFVVFKLH